MSLNIEEPRPTAALEKPRAKMPDDDEHGF
jgi:hypothetical protein